MKYFLGVLGVILVLILIVVLLFRGSNDTSSVENVKRLSEYATEANSEAVFTTAGAINAEENHRVVQVTVNGSTRTFEILDGYNGKASTTKTYPNTTEAFEAFLAALEQVGFTRTRNSSTSFDSVCPAGQRFSYSLVSGDETVVNAWSANCNKGTFGGNAHQTSRLFQAQIPDYQELTQDVNFSL